MRKSLNFKVELFRHKWPIIAAGFVGSGSEFLVSLWIIDFRIIYGY